MNTWVRLILTTAGAFEDFRAHMNELMKAEDSLSKAKTVEELHYQRGKVDGMRAVLFLVTGNAKKEN